MTDNDFRSDADYKLRRIESSDRFELVDKRTGHRWMFTSPLVKGYGGNVFLRHLSSYERHRDQTESSGNRAGMLNKETLPQWLIDELKHIRETGTMMPQTDPRD